MTFAGTYFIANRNTQVACTEDARLCPDGSYVARIPPKCDFAPCPTIQPTIDPTAGWKTYSNNEYGFSVKYPTTWEVIDITNEPVAIGVGKGGTSVTTPLKEFYSNKFNQDVELTITIFGPKDIRPLVPTKVGGFWISGIRLEIAKGDKDKEIANFSATEYKTENIIVNSIAVTKISRVVTGERKPAATTALFTKNELLYKLSNDAPGLGHGNDIFDQILQTFKFLDQP